MHNNVQIRKDFSEAAEVYDQHADLQQLVMHELISYAAPFVSEGMRILDAGCGTGKLAKEVAGANIIGFDVAYGMCQQAHQHMAALNGDMIHIPIAENSMDMVFSSLALQWVSDPTLFFDEVKRVLKPGGVLVCATLVDGTLDELRKSFMAIDRVPSVNAFISRKQLTESISLSQIKNEESKITKSYASIKNLMQSIRVIGAGFKGRKANGMLTPTKLDAMEGYYQKHYSTDDGIYASWNVLYGVWQA